MKVSISLFNYIRQQLLPADIIDVLRHRDFKLLFAATVVANLGDAFYFVALPWLVLAYGGSATAVGLTGAAAMLPYVLLGPLAGVISDRVNRKSLMIAADLARAFDHRRRRGSRLAWVAADLAFCHDRISTNRGRPIHVPGARRASPIPGT